MCVCVCTCGTRFGIEPLTISVYSAQIIMIANAVVNHLCQVVKRALEKQVYRQLVVYQRFAVFLIRTGFSADDGTMGSDTALCTFSVPAYRFTGARMSVVAVAKKRLSIDIVVSSSMYFRLFLWQ